MPYDHLSAAESVAAVAREHATRVDAEAAFPEATLAAARRSGLLALTCAAEVGGHGKGLAEACAVVERIARECASSAMVLTMHYSGTAVLEAHAGTPVRRAVAAGEHLSTLAFSEAGSRSHFWAPTSTARAAGNEVVLDAKKSWVTSARHATAYVWSSRPTAGSEASTLWLVSRTATGLAAEGHFEGLGLRGNDSLPVTATGVTISAASRLGPDGGGFPIMMQVVLPTFALLVSAGSVGLMQAAVARTAEHAAGTRYAHLDQQNTLADLPTIRAYIARMRIEADMAETLWRDALTAATSGRPDAMLRVLEVKAACGDAAGRVLDTAMRVCGGMAYRKDIGVERMFRDARAAMVMAPTSDQLFDFIGRAVCGLPLF